MALMNYAGDLYQPSLSEYQVIRHKVMQPVIKDSAKRNSTKGFQSPSYSLVGVQIPQESVISQEVVISHPVNFFL